MKKLEWFSGFIQMLLSCTDSASLQAHDFRTSSSIVIKKTIFAVSTCILAVGGAAVGTVVGAAKGQTTETGLIRGAAVGALAGAVTAVQLLELDRDSFSKVALLRSILSGKVFVEWVTPAVLKAYQWQVSMLETNYRESADIYDVAGVHGLSSTCIQALPVYDLPSEEITETCDEICCPICLQQLREGESARRLPNCGHLFHLTCVDIWLRRQGSCPLCRTSVLEPKNGLLLGCSLRCTNPTSLTTIVSF